MGIKLELASGNLIVSTMGRVWEDESLRAAFERGGSVVRFEVSDELGWSIRYGTGGCRKLAGGPAASVAWGAEQFRKLTGKEVKL